FGSTYAFFKFKKKLKTIQKRSDRRLFPPNPRKIPAERQISYRERLPLTTMIDIETPSLRTARQACAALTRVEFRILLNEILDDQENIAAALYSISNNL